MNSSSKITQITSISHLLIHLGFILFLSMSLIQLPLVSHGCHEGERRALLDFKSSIEDPSNRLNSWQEGRQYKNCCDWYGIECSGDSHVISINLRNTEYEISFDQFKHSDSSLDFSPPETALQGKFSPSLSNITHLRYLDLAFNNFQESQIPLQFSNLTKLTHLDLSNSNLKGLSLTQFTNLSFLVYLDLSSNNRYHLSSIEWLGGLVNLQVLRLSGIDLFEATMFTSGNSFAEHIASLSNLVDLGLSNCRISGRFPIQKFNNFSRLSYLDVSYNHELHYPLIRNDSPFPVHLANLTSLSFLYLTSCHLHGLVPYMPQLKELDVGRNIDLHLNLTRIFESRWPKLQLLGISSTKVTGLFKSLISNVPLLETLDASHCSIQGPIPKSMCEMSFLRHLNLGNNNFSGTIPSCITMLRYLNRLDISNNSIRGEVSLPSFISKLNLTILILSSNKITVSIDQHIHLHFELKLKELGLASCNLTGLFPAFICTSTRLEILDLSDNRITGIIPSCIHKLKSLSSLDASHNSFHGLLPLPGENTRFYNLAHNKFNGDISTEIGERLVNVTSILLSGNELTGFVPFSMCSTEKHSNTKYIDLSSNQLSGSIPTTIRYCTSLEYLNLGKNHLTGNIPRELAEARLLQFLQLNDNNLDGSILNIKELYNLVVLNVGNNNFQGSISYLSGGFYNIKILSLRSNNFNGSIPTELGYLQELQILDLSGNNISGLIPREIGNLAKLVSRSNDTYLLRSRYQADVQLEMVNKGVMMQFEKLYAYSSGIDLSSNMLEGEIPEEIGLLEGLSMLNLSHNLLSGEIPPIVGSMNGLDSLDLSFNKLSGPIPVSLASMDSLGYLNLSYNNLSGRVPTGPHFDTLGGDGSAYVHNTFLCGYLTKNACNGDQSSDIGDSNLTPSEVDRDEEDETRDEWYFYGVVALAFIIGFWGLFFGLLLKKETWWFGYWTVVHTVAVKIVQLFLKD